MKKFILFAFFTLFTTIALYAQDNVFVVDGKQIENFDGSQLTGKKILLFHRQKIKDGEAFFITTDATLPDSLRNRPLRISRKIQVVNTEAADATAANTKIGNVEMTTTTFKTMPLLIVDGKIFEGSFDSIKPDDIKGVMVYKAGTDVANAYGDKGKNGVMKIFTKATIDNVVYKLNGKPASYREISDIPSSKVSNINVLKRGSKAAMKYGKDGETHDIVLVSTK